jgi:hypothetical protein
VAAQADDVSSLVKADIFALRASRSDFDPNVWSGRAVQEALVDAG